MANQERLYPLYRGKEVVSEIIEFFLKAGDYIVS